MQIKLPFAGEKKKYLGWIILLLLIVVGVLAYFFREPLSKSFIFRRAEIEETLLPPEETVEISDLEESPLKIEEEKIVKEETKTPLQEQKEISQKETSSEEKIYTEVAQRGEGITHLARKALGRYLQEKGENISLTKAHKIYIEDYMQKRTGWRWLKLGEKVSFSEKLIEEAIEKSLTLSEAQLQNILNYTPPPTFVE